MNEGLTNNKIFSMKYQLLASLLFCIGLLNAQDNYEIQVYSAPTQAKNSTIFELHSNFTFDGERNIIENVRPTHHATHETLEVTTGITDNFEIGVYLFTNITPGYGFEIVGTHIRPRITAPDSWKLPVGLSFSAELGLQKSVYATDNWSLELRPIIDKQWNKFYAAFNPTFSVSLVSDFNSKVPVFQPNAKVSYSFFKKANLGIEYYGATGYVNETQPINNQAHAVYFVYDMVGSVDWELNFGVGLGLTEATDKLVGKVILGRRINWKKTK